MKGKDGDIGRGGRRIKEKRWTNNGREKKKEKRNKIKINKMYGSVGKSCIDTLNYFIKGKIIFSYFLKDTFSRLSNKIFLWFLFLDCI